MSQIYLATQSGIGGFRKLVVLKTILPDIGGEEDFVRMFLEEARTTAAFNHPNIAQVYELDVDAGELFMAMEFVQGCTLVEMAKACRAAKEPIPIGFTLQSVRDTALALHYAHTFTDARGRKLIVIHRDVAEKNIMVTYEGVTKLLDFGIAKALGRSSRTSIGMVKGTSGYMSPEQIRGEPLDARSDIFSLGVVLHECLTGLRLFHGKNPEEGMMAALNTNVAPPSKMNPQVSPEVDAVVMKALQRRREDRFGTALEFARAIDKAAPGLIWHPEQTAELVSRHFADRRQETRRLLEATNFGGETTGELRIDSLLARVKVEPRSNVPTLPPSVPVQPVPPPTPPTGVPNSLKRPLTPNPFAQTIPVPQSQTSDTDTNPARPKVMRANSSPDNQTPSAVPVVVRLDPGSNYDADDSEAKTIPAAALPDEIKALRAKLMQPKPQATQPMTDAVPAFQSVVVAPEPPKIAPPNLVKTIPAGALAPERSNTGETISITSRGEAAWDEEPEAKTAIGLPFESNRQPARRSIPGSAPAPAPAKPKNPRVEQEEDLRELAAANNRSLVLVTAILVPLFIAAVLAVLYAAGLPPFERESPVPTRNNIQVPPSSAG